MPLMDRTRSLEYTITGGHAAYIDQLTSDKENGTIDVRVIQIYEGQAIPMGRLMFREVGDLDIWVSDEEEWEEFQSGVTWPTLVGIVEPGDWQEDRYLIKTSAAEACFQTAAPPIWSPVEQLGHCRSQNG